MAFCFIYKNSDYNLLPIEGIIWRIDYIKIYGGAVQECLYQVGKMIIVFQFHILSCLRIREFKCTIVFILGNVLGLDEWHLPICYQKFWTHHFPGKMSVPSQQCVVFQLFRWLKTQIVELLIGFVCFCGLSLLIWVFFYMKKDQREKRYFYKICRFFLNF